MHLPDDQDSESGHTSSACFARFGSFMLSAPCGHPPSEVVIERVCGALRDDPRIKEIGEVRIRPEWTATRESYPHTRHSDADADALLSGSDHFHSVRFSDPIAFTVSVPIRNQPAFKGYRDVPTDTYWVAWDGVTAVVLWERESDLRVGDNTASVPRSGGHVVADILHAAASAAGFDLYVQSCSPNCENLFAHRLLWIDTVAPTSKQPMLKVVRESLGQNLAIELRSDGQGTDLALDLLHSLRLEGGYFAHFKNSAQRIFDLDDLAHKLVGELLELHYDRNLRRRKPVHLQPIASWKARGERRRAEEIIASLWLAISRVQALRSQWFPLRDRFLESTQKYGTAALFELDHKDDQRAVERQDLEFVRAAVEQSANRLDSRYVALLTGLSALSGLIGAVVGVAAS